MAVRFAANTAFWSRTANLPPNSSFSMMAWAKQYQDANINSIVLSNAGSGDGYTIETAADGSTYELYGIGGTATFNRQPGLRNAFCCALTFDGTTLSGYLRRVGDSNWDAVTLTPTTQTVASISVGRFVPTAATGFRGSCWNFKVWDRVLTAQQLLDESRVDYLLDPRDANLFWRMRHAGDLIDYGPHAQRRPTRNGTPITSADGPQIGALLPNWRPARRSVDAAVAGGATTRGMPFGNRSTAFNGGRTFVGPIN